MNPSSAERVRKEYPGASPSPWQLVVVEGLDLFWTRWPSKGADHDRGHGVAVTATGEVYLGAGAMRAAVDRLGERRGDAVALAQLASFFVGNGGAAITESAEPARPPRIDGAILEYWTRTSPVEHPGLTRWRVDLGAFTVERVSASEIHAAAEDPVSRATSLLRSGSSTSERKGIELLKGHVADPRAASLLVEALEKAGAPEIRALAATTLGESKDPKVVTSLLAALGDKAGAVRARSAAALGRIGDARARPPLERLAASDPDDDAKAAAQRALAQLR